MSILQEPPVLYVDTPHSPAPIAYTEQGKGDMLIFVHGSLCDLRYWRWQLKKLAPFFHAISFSLPGYWPANPRLSTCQFGLAQHIKALNTLIQAKKKNNQRLFIVGHSRGAMVALRYAIQHTDNLQGLALADPAFLLDQATAPLPVLIQAADLLANNQDDAALALFIDAVSGANTWQKMVGWFKIMVEDNAYTLLAQSCEQLPAIRQAELSILSNLELLLISGQKSPIRYQRSAEQLKQAFPAFKHYTISNASHGMNLSNPNAFNEILKNVFLKKHTATRQIQ